MKHRVAEGGGGGRVRIELVFIIKNSLAQSWNAFVLKYAAAAAAATTKVQQAKQRAAGVEKQRGEGERKAGKAMQ